MTSYSGFRCCRNYDHCRATRRSLHCERRKEVDHKWYICQLHDRCRQDWWFGSERHLYLDHSSQGKGRDVQEDPEFGSPCKWYATTLSLSNHERKIDCKRQVPRTSSLTTLKFQWGIFWGRRMRAFQLSCRVADPIMLLLDQELTGSRFQP